MKAVSLALAALLFGGPVLAQQPPPQSAETAGVDGRPEDVAEPANASAPPSTSAREAPTADTRPPERDPNEVTSEPLHVGVADPTEPSEATTRATAPTELHSADAGASRAVQDANNPLAPVLGFNLQNYYSPSLNELPDTSSNAMLLRVVSPFWRLLPRATLPVAMQSGPTDSVSGLGDLQIFVAYLMTPPGAKLQFGLGPQYTAPTATNPALGSGKHSLGGAAVLVWVHDKLMLGSLVQAQGSIAGDTARPDVTTMWTQIFAILQLGGGYYLRSTPVATFQFASGDYQVPIGLGVGKVVMIDRTVLNWFAEPQATFLVEGAGQPLFQLFMGLNIQYKL